MTNDQKQEVIKGFALLVAQQALQLFNQLELENFMEAGIVDDVSGERFEFSFKKIGKEATNG